MKETGTGDRGPGIGQSNSRPIPDPGSPVPAIIRERAPLTVAAFMELALYHPELGYYARAARRSGRAGDFFTSVDVGAVFGQLLAVQIAEMSRILNPEASSPHFDLVEAGAGSGRLSADILRALRTADAPIYEATRLHLVEASASARAAQCSTLGDVGERLASSRSGLPESFEGVLLANELLDAMPVHQVVMREDGLREVYVSRQPTVDSQQSRVNSRLTTVEGPPSTTALAEYLSRVGVTLEPGWRVEVNLRAVDWVREAARRLRRGFVILIDYGHEAHELYSASHSAGTLTSFSGHRSVGAEAGTPEWLHAPGEQDITSHVDWTSVRDAAEGEGLQTIALLDQTYLLMGLFPHIADAVSRQPSALRGFKTLVMPGGLGSSHKALILGKGVGTPALKGCSFKVRLT